MRLGGRRESENIEDRRGQGGFRRGGFGRGMGGGFGGGRRVPVRGGIGVVGLLVVLGLSLALGIDPRLLLEGGTYEESAPAPQAPAPEMNDEMKRFVAAVLADTEDTWHAIFNAHGQTYQEPVLVLFAGGTRSGCGFAQSAVGPFYCPADRKVYLDLGFFDELQERFGAPGDFAQAYVIAHEVAHHVQTLMGTSARVREMQQRVSTAEANGLSVRMELQADCFAGIWAYHADRSRGVLETGDIEEGLRAAAAIGDDTLQRSAGREVTPDSFTHGSSEQRVRWFRRGFDSGEIRACDTFGVGTL